MTRPTIVHQSAIIRILRGEATSAEVWPRDALYLLGHGTRFGRESIDSDNGDSVRVRVIGDIGAARSALAEGGYVTEIVDMHVVELVTGGVA